VFYLPTKKTLEIVRVLHNSRDLPAALEGTAIEEGLRDLQADRVTPKFSSVAEFKAYRQNKQ
jgi:hypothetical protein